MPFSKEEAEQVAAQLMESAPPNVPSNGRRRSSQEGPQGQRSLLKSRGSGSFKGLFGFRGEPHQLAWTCVVLHLAIRVLISDMVRAVYSTMRELARTCLM